MPWRPVQWIQASLARQFMVAALGLLLIAGGGVSLLAIAKTTSLLQAQIEGRLDTASELGRHRLELILGSIRQQVAELAASTLVVNSLVDSAERSTYLEPFLKKYGVSGGTPFSLTLFNFKGDVYASNARPLPPSVGNHVWFPTIIDTGRARAVIEDGKLRLAFPVIYSATGLPEGVLVGDLNLSDVVRQALSPLDPSLAFFLKAPDGTSVASWGDHGTEDDLVVKKVLQLASPLDETGLSLELREDRGEAFSPMTGLWIEITFLGLGVAGLAGIMAGYLGRRVTRRLSRLAEAAVKIGDDVNASVELDIQGQDEVGVLAGSFAGMIGRLQNSYRELEDRVRDRTSELFVAGQEIAAQAEKLEAVLAEVVDGIITIDSKGIMQSANRAAERIFGWPSHHMIGRNVRMLMPAEHGDRHDEYLRRYLVTGEAKVIGKGRQVAGLRHNGEEFPMELAVSEVRHGSNRLFVGVVRDITERIQAQEVLTRAKEAAEDAARAKAEFLAIMSHEIRTPLNGILGTVGLLLETPLEDKQRKLASVAQRSGKALLGIVNDILDFSKIEAGKLELAVESFDLRRMVAETVSIVQPRADEKSLKIKIQVSDNLSDWVVGDQGRLQQVLMNLLSNAVKFTESGTVSLEITLAEETNRVMFGVRDTGIGISAEDQRRLFEKFSQVESASNRRFGGTGLGLAISRALVNRMAGTIGLESLPGKGSFFWFEVPLPAGEAQAKNLAETVNRMTFSGNVLLVDDSETNRFVIGSMLEAVGLKVTTVDNGAQALETVSREDFDLVLMDVNMPEMDGMEATRRIRARPEARSDLPIIALTALALPGDAERCLEAGMDDYLSKPVDRATLALKLSRYLTRREESDEPMMPGEESVNDLIADTSPEAARRIAEKVAGELERRSRQLEQEIADRNLVNTTREAHTIKGLAATLGIEALRALALSAETAGHENREDAFVLAEKIPPAAVKAATAIRDRFGLSSVGEE